LIRELVLKRKIMKLEVGVAEVSESRHHPSVVKFGIEDLESWHHPSAAEFGFGIWELVLDIAASSFGCGVQFGIQWFGSLEIGIGRIDWVFWDFTRRHACSRKFMASVCGEPTWFGFLVRISFLDFCLDFLARISFLSFCVCGTLHHLHTDVLAVGKEKEKR
jgi:hypothetical protein